LTITCSQQDESGHIFNITILYYPLQSAIGQTTLIQFSISKPDYFGRSLATFI